MKTGYSKKAVAALHAAGVTEKTRKKLVATIWNQKRKARVIDASDEPIDCQGVKLSYIRNFSDMSAVIILPEEMSEILSYLFGNPEKKGEGNV